METGFTPFAPGKLPRFFRSEHGGMDHGGPDDCRCDTGPRLRPAGILAARRDCAHGRRDRSGGSCVGHPKNEMGLMKSNMIVLGTGLLLVAGVAQAQPPPSKEITLADWGFKNASEIGYLSVGLLHKKEGDELVVHDIRKQKPTLKEPEQAVSRVPKIEGDLFLVARFDRGNLNRLNGYFNAFVRAPSQGALSIGPAPDG